MLVTISEILGGSLQLYTRNFRRWLPYLGLLFLPTLVMSILGILGLFLQYHLPNSALIANMTVLTIYVASLVFSIWAGIALIRVIKFSFDNTPLPPWSELFTDSSRMIWPMIYTTLLVFLIIFAGSILLIIPGIIFGIWYCFANYILIFEEKNGMRALVASKELVVNRWWPIFWRILIPAIVYSLVFFVFNTVVSKLCDLFIHQLFWNELTYSLATDLLNLLFLPLLTGAIIILYTSAKTNPVSIILK